MAATFATWPFCALSWNHEEVMTALLTLRIPVWCRVWISYRRAASGSGSCDSHRTEAMLALIPGHQQKLVKGKTPHASQINTVRYSYLEENNLWQYFCVFAEERIHIRPMTFSLCMWPAACCGDVCTDIWKLFNKQMKSLHRNAESPWLHEDRLHVCHCSFSPSQQTIQLLIC